MLKKIMTRSNLKKVAKIEKAVKRAVREVSTEMGRLTKRIPVKVSFR